MSTFYKLSKPLWTSQSSNCLPRFTLRTPTVNLQLLQCFPSLLICLVMILIFRHQLYLWFEQSLPNLSVNYSLNTCWYRAPQYDGETNKKTGCLVVRGEQHHRQGHQLHGPLDQVDSTGVGGRS